MNQDVADLSDPLSRSPIKPCASAPTDAFADSGGAALPATLSIVRHAGRFVTGITATPPGRPGKDASQAADGGPGPWVAWANL